MAKKHVQVGHGKQHTLTKTLKQYPSHMEDPWFLYGKAIYKWWNRPLLGMAVCAPL